MALTGISLDAASSTGPGAVIVPDSPRQNVKAQIDATGNPDAVIRLEGTVDSVHWFFLNQLALTSGGVQSEQLDWSGAPVVAFRANLISLSGGSSPTVTATIAIGQ